MVRWSLEVRHQSKNHCPLRRQNLRSGRRGRRHKHTEERVLVQTSMCMARSRCFQRAQQFRSKSQRQRTEHHSEERQCPAGDSRVEVQDFRPGFGRR